MAGLAAETPVNGRRRGRGLVLLVPGALGLFLVAGSLVDLAPRYGVYDGKRLVQLWLLTGVLALALAVPDLRRRAGALLAGLPPVAGLTLAVFFALGLASALTHPPVFYPLADVALLALLSACALVVAASRSLAGAAFDRLALAALAVLAAGVALQELMGLLAGMASGDPFRFEYMAIHFAHPRFYNHLQTVSIPLLAALPFVFRGTRGMAGLAVALLALQWCLLFFSGGRASLVALGVALAVVLVLLGRHRPRWLAVQALGLAAGLALFAALLAAQGQMFDEPQARAQVAEQSVGRYTARSTSGRTRLWREALAQSRQAPLLGIGPARYACAGPRGLGSHPHSFPLQLLAEWGWPATALLAALAGGLAWRLGRLMRASRDGADPGLPLQQALSVSLAAAAGHAALSGVLVVPAGQTAVALVGGWLLGITARPAPGGSGGRGALALLPALAVAAGLAVAATGQARWLHGVFLPAHPHTLLSPRFWHTGGICAYEEVTGTAG